MELIALKCPNCGGSIDFDRSREFGFCQYCGTKIMIQEEMEKQKITIDDSKRIAGWVDNAKLFFERGNKSECHRYAMMASDADPNNGMAWYYRAKSATTSDDEITSIVRAMDMFSTSDPIYHELEILKAGALDKVNLTIIDMIPHDVINVFLDGELLDLPKGSKKTFSVPRNSTHTIDAKTSHGSGNKSITVTVTQDVVYSVSTIGFGLRIKQV